MSAARPTPSSFAGFPAGGLRFLEGLARHNTREWFHEHKADTPQLAALRVRIAKDHVAFRRLVEERAVTKAFGVLQGERLVRVPKPFPAEHPAADLLRLKQAYFLVTLPVGLVTSKRLVPEVAERFRLGAPLVTWLARTLA